jgi:hypothetical protein
MTSPTQEAQNLTAAISKVSCGVFYSKRRIESHSFLLTQAGARRPRKRGLCPRRHRGGQSPPIHGISLFRALGFRWADAPSRGPCDAIHERNAETQIKNARIGRRGAKRQWRAMPERMACRTYQAVATGFTPSAGSACNTPCDAIAACRPLPSSAAAQTHARSRCGDWRCSLPASVHRR